MTSEAEQLEAFPLLAEDIDDDLVGGTQPPQRVVVHRTGVDRDAQVAVDQVAKIGFPPASMPALIRRS